MRILTAAEMREVDRLTTEKYRVPSLTLMENAGRSVAELIQARFPDVKQRHFTVLCGKGNNGGDGFVAARYLRRMGARVSVYLIGNARDVKTDAAVNLKRWNRTGKRLVEVSSRKRLTLAFQDSDIIVDALVGTGARGPLEGQFADVVKAVNQHEPGCVVIAVDIPSGLDADTGAAPGAVIVADYTVTFTAPKPGLLLGAGPEHVGDLVVSEIGSPRPLVEETGKGNLRWSEAREFARFATPRRASGHKGDYGHVLVVAGSVGKSGAAVLAGTAALRAGAGLVTVATPEPVLPIVAAYTPEIMTEPLAATRSGTVSERCLEGGLFSKILEGKRTLAIGPGLTTQVETQAFVRGIVGARETVPVVLDADGLNAFAGRGGELRNPKGLLAITPHPGEMGRLLGCSTRDVQARRIDVAREAATDWNAFVILKGHQTVIAAPDGRLWINSTGNPGMGTGGTGDVLTGILAGLTAQYGADSWPEMLAFGVYLHGLAGDMACAETGGAALMATDLISYLPGAFRQFHSECGRG
jgi:ADP-dependent NAD(P)H-hydrate dehydratase / NAD(P)H-hydrate epimerase